MGAIRRNFLISASVIGAVVGTAGAAQAGGFAVREQSAYGQGASFAGIAAGGAPSAMYWNPATMTQTTGLTTESTAALLLPNVVNTPGVGTVPLLALGGSGNIGDTALVPSSYAIWQAMPNLYLGLSINAPFGLGVSTPFSWAGYPYARDTEAKTYNFAPSVAIRLNDMISLGFGLQVQYMDVDFNSGLFGVGANNNLNLSGDGFGFGVTAGITFTPTPTTTIGLGWRSAINQNLEGSLLLPPVLVPPGSTPGPIEATVRLPDIVSLGLRQRIGPAFTLLGTIEWTNWSRIGTTNIEQSSGLPALVAGSALRLPFQYEDGWFYSIGAEYNWSPALTLRAGLGFEQSPITDRERTPRIPDADRTWVSIGASYQWTSKLSLDIAYTHVFVDDANINISAASGNPWFSGTTYIGTAESRLDILSVGIRYKWFDPPAAPLITKG